MLLNRYKNHLDHFITNPLQSLEISSVLNETVFSTWLVIVRVEECLISKKIKKNVKVGRTSLFSNFGKLVEIMATDKGGSF